MTNSVAVAGIVLIKVGVNPLYNAPIPSCRTIFLKTIKAGVFKFCTWFPRHFVIRDKKLRNRRIFVVIFENIPVFYS